VLLEMYILPVIGSGADADNGMAHLVTFIHSFILLLEILHATTTGGGGCGGKVGGPNWLEASCRLVSY